MITESLTEIEETLALIGKQLVFSFGNILAVFGFRVTMLFRNDNVVNGTETQEFSFVTSTQQCVDNNVAEKDTFIYTDGIYNYNFKVLQNPIPTTDGWSTFTASLVSRELV
jgi:hypothetical protein